jgi:hypothetical protein
MHCQRCSGSGSISTHHYVGGDGWEARSVHCPDCDGYGFVSEEEPSATPDGFPAPTAIALTLKSELDFFEKCMTDSDRFKVFLTELCTEYTKNGETATFKTALETLAISSSYPQGVALGVV